MKNNILFSLLFSLSIVPALTAQEMDVDSAIKIKNDKFEANLGGRFMADAAYYSTDYTQMRSGFAINDARLRTLLKYEKWSLFADFDFSYGKFTQKDVYLKYDFSKESNSGSSLKAGYYAEPTSMSRNTSRYDYHFFTRPNSVNALAQGRSLGVSYKYYTNDYMLHQGVFTENKYNDQAAGFQGLGISGRWLFRPVNNANATVHLGAGVRYATVKTGEINNGLLQTKYELTSPLNTNVDNTNIFLNAELPWSKSVLDLNAEVLFKTKNFFARAEYMYKIVTKQRPDQILFENQLGGLWSWTTLESWQKGNPIRNNSFNGGYLEMGCLIFGDQYKYNNENGVISGKANNGLELVGRYSYTNLNDIVEGEYFLYGKKKFYPSGVIGDYPPVSTSVAGGKMHSATLGLNYTFNKYAKVMVDYTYSRVDNVNLPMDKNIHAIQSRVMFTF